MLYELNKLETTRETAMAYFSQQLRNMYLDNKGRHINLQDYTAHEMLTQLHVIKDYYIQCNLDIAETSYQMEIKRLLFGDDHDDYNYDDDDADHDYADNDDDENDEYLYREYKYFSENDISQIIESITSMA
jgi:hypothetical protein